MSLTDYEEHGVGRFGNIQSGVVSEIDMMIMMNTMNGMKMMHMTHMMKMMVMI